MEAEGMDTSLVNLFCVTREPAKDEDTRNLIVRLPILLSSFSYFFFVSNDIVYSYGFHVLINCL